MSLDRKLKAQKELKSKRDYLAEFQRLKHQEHLKKIQIEKTGIETADIYNRAQVNKIRKPIHPTLKSHQVTWRKLVRRNGDIVKLSVIERLIGLRQHLLVELTSVKEKYESAMYTSSSPHKLKVRSPLR